LEEESIPIAWVEPWQDVNPTNATRSVIPNREPREHANVVIPPIGPIRRQEPDRKKFVQFHSVLEVLEAVDAAPSYWNLDPCGRVRVLMKLCSTFAKAEPLSVLYCSFRSDELTDDDAGVRKLWERLGIEETREWSPSLFVDDPIYGMLKIEPSCAGMLGGTEQTIVTRADFDNYTDLIEWPSWDGDCPPFEMWDRMPPDSFIFCAFAHPHLVSNAKGANLRFTTTQSWTDPTITRPVLREILAARG
jgi:hypothetical protein